MLSRRLRRVWSLYEDTRGINIKQGRLNYGLQERHGTSRYSTRSAIRITVSAVSKLAWFGLLFVSIPELVRFCGDCGGDGGSGGDSCVCVVCD